MAKEKSQGPITRALSKAKEFVKDKIYDCRVKIHNSIPKKNKEKTSTMSSKAKKDLIFYIVMMIYPVAYFLFFYVAVNANSFALAFKTYEIDEFNNQYTVFAGFANFESIFQQYVNSSLLKSALKNSVVVYLYGLLAVPLGVLFSYYIAKKVAGHEFFKVMLFLPSILSALILVIMYKYVVERLYPAVMLEFFGQTVKGLLADPNTRFGALVFYSMLTSFGASVLIYSGAIDRIPESIIESAKLEGVTGLQEFWHITLPLIFPTISTFLIVGVAGIFTNQFNLFSIYGISPPSPDMYTLGYYLFAETAFATNLSYPRLSAFGILFTIIVIPLTFGLRFILEKFGTKEVEF